MKTTILILSALFLSTSVMAQKLPFKLLPQQKIEGEFIKKLKPSESTDSLVNFQKTAQRILPIAIPNAKSKDSSIYLALKGKTKNEEDYPILNTFSKSQRLKK